MHRKYVSEHNESASPNAMDALKTTFLPNLSIDSGILPSAHYCTICGLQFERAQHVAEHHMLAHSGVGVVTGVGSGILLPTPNQPPVTDSLKIEYPCLSCDDKFPNAHELDEHYRLVHQSATFLSRCLSCGVYGMTSVAMNDGDEYKCMHCGSVCTAAALEAGQPPYLDPQHDVQPHTPDEMPSIPPEEMSSLSPHEQSHSIQQQPQQQQQQQQPQQQQQQQQQQHHQDQELLHEQQRQQQQEEMQQQRQNQQEQQQQLQIQSQHREVQATDQRKVPPITVKLNKGINGNGEGHPQVIIKKEPQIGEVGSGNSTPTSVPVYTPQQPLNETNVARVSSAAFEADNGANTVTVVGNKVRHKCPDCPKTFKTPGTLAMHRKIHSGEAHTTPKERPFTCSYCGKSFTQSNTLKQHTRIHTGEKPYRCNYCEKSFSVKDYLTKHIRTHTGEKPYTCQYCEKRFTQRSALTVHTTKLHPL